jgi:hypothetical protein
MRKRKQQPVPIISDVEWDHQIASNDISRFVASWLEQRPEEGLHAMLAEFLRVFWVHSRDDEELNGWHDEAIGFFMFPTGAI